MNNYNKKQDLVSCLITITTLVLGLKNSFNSSGNNTKKLIDLIRNPEIDTKMKSRVLIALNDICFHCFESVVPIFNDVLGIYTYIINLLHQEFNFTVR